MWKTSESKISYNGNSQKYQVFPKFRVRVRDRIRNRVRIRVRVRVRVRIRDMKFNFSAK